MNETMEQVEALFTHRLGEASEFGYFLSLLRVMGVANTIKYGCHELEYLRTTLTAAGFNVTPLSVTVVQIGDVELVFASLEGRYLLTRQSNGHFLVRRTMWAEERCPHCQYPKTVRTWQDGLRWHTECANCGRMGHNAPCGLHLATAGKLRRADARRNRHRSLGDGLAAGRQDSA